MFLKHPSVVLYSVITTQGHFCWHLTVGKSGGDDKQNVPVSLQSSPK